MLVNKIRNFIFKNYYQRIGFSKENSYYSVKSLKRKKKKKMLLLASKLIEKIPDSRNAKEHYQSFIRKKNTKSVKQSEIITYQPKSFWKPRHCWFKSVITEHLKTLYELSKTIRHAEKLGSNSSLYSDIKKEKFFKLKKCKNNKTSTCF